jgi:hypothetical protein
MTASAVPSLAGAVPAMASGGTEAAADRLAGC